MGEIRKQYSPTFKARVVLEESSWEEEKARYDARINELYAEIGRLSTQLNWQRPLAIYDLFAEGGERP